MASRRRRLASTGLLCFVMSCQMEMLGPSGAWLGRLQLYSLLCGLTLVRSCGPRLGHPAAPETQIPLHHVSQAGLRTGDATPRVSRLPLEILQLQNYTAYWSTRPRGRSTSGSAWACVGGGYLHCRTQLRTATLHRTGTLHTPAAADSRSSRRDQHSSAVHSMSTLHTYPYLVVCRLQVPAGAELGCKCGWNVLPQLLSLRTDS